MWYSGVESDGGEITIGGVVIPRVEKFKYLGSIVEEKRDIDEDINHSVRVGWQKWKKASEVLCDNRIPFRLKGRVYRMVVRPALLYGAKCWPIKKTQAQRLNVTEMRMLQRMCGYTRLDRIRNVVIRERVGVIHLEEKLRETRLRSFGHIKRSVDAPVKRCEALDLLHYRERRTKDELERDY